MKKEQTKEVDIKSEFPTIATFTIKATISTGSYSNISPELTINNISIEDIDNIILPKLDSLFDRYIGFNDKVAMNHSIEKARAIVQNTPSQLPVDEVGVVLPEVDIETQSASDETRKYIASEKLQKALDMIESAQSKDPLEQIHVAVEKSVNLNDEEKNMAKFKIQEKLMMIG